jgi:DNA-binding XRE family transcriptional regulator
MELPELVRELRTRAGMTQTDLDRKAGLREGTVGRIERGATDARGKQLMRIIYATGHEFIVRKREG